MKSSNAIEGKIRNTLLGRSENISMEMTAEQIEFLHKGVEKMNGELAEGLAKSAMGLTPGIEQSRDHFKKQPLANLKQEKINLVRQAQDYGVKATTQMSFKEIIGEIQARKSAAFDSDTLVQLDQLETQVKGLEIASNFVQASEREQSKLAFEQQIEKDYTVRDWYYMVKGGYYLGYYPKKQWVLLYSLKGDKEYCRAVCKRTNPANGYDTQNVVTVFNSYAKNGEQTIDKTELDLLINAKLNWKELINAYELKSVKKDSFKDDDCSSYKWKWDFWSMTIIHHFSAN